MSKVVQLVREKLFCSRKRGTMVVSIGLSVLLSGLVFTPVGKAAANAIQNVRVVNTASEAVPVTGNISVNNQNPIPVSGNVEVNNQTPILVDSQQKGNWTVGISTADNIVKLDPATSMQVANTSANPLTVNVNNLGKRQPFALPTYNVSWYDSNYKSSEFYPAIPSGKRFVIENIGVEAQLPVGKTLQVSVATLQNSVRTGFLTEIPQTKPWSSDLDRIASTYQYKGYVEPGDCVYIMVEGSSLLAFMNSNFLISGYLEDLN